MRSHANPHLYGVETTCTKAVKLMKHLYVCPPHIALDRKQTKAIELINGWEEAHTPEALRLRSIKNSKFSPQEQIRIGEIYLMGYSTLKIAKALETSSKTINQCLVRHSIELRSKQVSGVIGKDLPELIAPFGELQNG